MAIKRHNYTVLIVLSVLLGGLVGFLVVKMISGSRRRRRLGEEVATFDFYVDGPEPSTSPEDETAPGARTSAQ